MHQRELTRNLANWIIARSAFACRNLRDLPHPLLPLLIFLFLSLFSFILHTLSLISLLTPIIPGAILRDDENSITLRKNTIHLIIPNEIIVFRSFIYLIIIFIFFSCFLSTLPMHIIRFPCSIVLLSFIFPRTQKEKTLVSQDREYFPKTREILEDQKSHETRLWDFWFRSERGREHDPHENSKGCITRI